MLILRLRATKKDRILTLLYFSIVVPLEDLRSRSINR